MTFIEKYNCAVDVELRASAGESSEPPHVVGVEVHFGYHGSS